MIPRRRKPSGSAHLLLGRSARALLAALRRAKLPGGVGSPVLCQPPESPLGCGGAWPLALGSAGRRSPWVSAGAGGALGAGGWECSAPAWQEQGERPLGNHAALKPWAPGHRPAQAPGGTGSDGWGGVGCLVLGRAWALLAVQALTLLAERLSCFLKDLLQNHRILE